MKISPKIKASLISLLILVVLLSLVRLFYQKKERIIEKKPLEIEARKFEFFSPPVSEEFSFSGEIIEIEDKILLMKILVSPSLLNLSEEVKPRYEIKKILVNEDTKLKKVSKEMKRQFTREGKFTFFLPIELEQANFSDLGINDYINVICKKGVKEEEFIAIEIILIE